MSYETKQLAEKLIQLHNSASKLDEVIRALNSTDNTVVDDLTKLVDGAKLEPQFDINKMSDLANDLRSDIFNAEDYINSAIGCLDDANSCVSGVVSYADELCNLIDDAKYELKKDDEDSDDEEGSD